MNTKDHNYVSLHLHGGRTRKMLTLEVGRSHPHAMQLRQPEKVMEIVEKWLREEWPTEQPPARELLVELDGEGES